MKRSILRSRSRKRKYEMYQIKIKRRVIPLSNVILNRKFISDITFISQSHFQGRNVNFNVTNAKYILYVYFNFTIKRVYYK